MIKKRMVGVIVFLVLSLGLSYRAEAGESLKIGYVDVGAVIDRYAKTHELEKALEKDKQDKQKEIEGMAKEIDKLEEQLKTKAPGLKEEKKKRRAEIIKEKKDKQRRLFREYDLEIKSKVYAEQRELIKEIQKAVRSYGKGKGYTLILDGRTVLYGLESLDLTGEIVKILNTAEGK